MDSVTVVLNRCGTFGIHHCFFVILGTCLTLLATLIFNELVVYALDVLGVINQSVAEETVV